MKDILTLAALMLNLGCFIMNLRSWRRANKKHEEYIILIDVLLSSLEKSKIALNKAKNAMDKYQKAIEEFGEKNSD